MKPFIDQDFLLAGTTARQLYQLAKSLPIIDYHCHVSPREIAENRQFDNIAQLWLSGDHYKWRLMRQCGVPERLITGDADDYEKFKAFAAVLPLAIGNPIHHWTHLELQRSFNCQHVLGPDTAAQVWAHCNGVLQDGLTVRDLILQYNVTIICTTDDPADELGWHQELATDQTFATKVFPAFRPDQALQIAKPGFSAYISQLAASCRQPIRSFNDLKAALSARLDYFVQHGCCLSDHGLETIPWLSLSINPEEIFAKALAGEPLSPDEVETHQAALLTFLAAGYEKRGIVMQLHYGAQRNVNPRSYREIGPDSGFDCIGTPNVGSRLAGLLGGWAEQNILPRTILYAMNPADNALLACLAGAFTEEGVAGKVQHGSAWWFNDTKIGIEQQLTTLASMGALGTFVGMLTDSRSFLSYTRHEYFRRIVCNLIGNWVDTGEYPDDQQNLEHLIRRICHDNAAAYFNWPPA